MREALIFLAGALSVLLFVAVSIYADMHKSFSFPAKGWQCTQYSQGTVLIITPEGTESKVERTCINYRKL